MSENLFPLTGSTRQITRARNALRRLIRRVGADDRTVVEVSIIEQSGMFDRRYYLQRYPDIAASGMDPIEHYVKHGADEGRNPNATFNTVFYLRSNPDVAASGMNPLRHFVEFGNKENRQPASGISRKAVRPPMRVNGAAIAIQASQDDAATINRLIESSVEVIGRSGLFDSEYYLKQCPDLVKAGMNPIEHYVKYGAREGKNPCDLFDTRYYLESNPDVAASNGNPLTHFCKFGWKELRNPSADFDVCWYWLMYLAESGGDINPLAHYVLEGRADALPTRNAGKFSLQDKGALSAICENLLKKEGLGETEVTRVGVALLKLSRWADAEAAFRRVVGLDWSDARAHYRLAEVLVRQCKWWQVVESLKIATKLDLRHASWFQLLGEAHEEMSQFSLAIEAYQRGVDLNPRNARRHYLLGYAHERAGHAVQAELAYAEAIRRDSRSEVKTFGIGVFHQDRGHWSAAALAYERALHSNPLLAGLHYRHGMALERCYKWQDAQAAYEKSIALCPQNDYWHYRLGFVLERQGHWAEAAVAYRVSAELDGAACHRFYRQGHVLAQAGRHHDACVAYIRTRTNQKLENLAPIPVGESAAISTGTRSDIGAISLIVADADHETEVERYIRKFDVIEIIRDALSRDQSNPETHFRLGLELERAADFDGAAIAYSEAVDRKQDHSAEWYYRLGYVLFKADRYKAACEAFRETRILRGPYGVDRRKYENNSAQKSLMEYNEYLETLPIRKNVVLYESFGGASISDNPKAIFLYLLGHPEHSYWKHVWVIKPGQVVPDQYRKFPNIVFVERDTDLYRRYLASAGYLINNSTFPTWFIRRPEQKYLNTWHGTPLKSMGKDIKGNFFERKNTARNFLHCTHMLSPNAYTSDILLRRYDVAEIFPGKLAETGYPRIDQLINATEADKKALRDRLALSSGLPVVLYAPTWRGVLGDSRVEEDRLVSDLQALSDLPCQIVFRGHYFVVEKLAEVGVPVTIAPQDIDACELLAITDVLITDYSSIFFDFYPTGRPVLHYVYDHEEYANERGLYLDMEELPGALCHSIEELRGSLTGALRGLGPDSATYRAARARFCPYEDGDATRRAVEFFFNDSSECVIDRYANGKKSLLFYAGSFPAQGITASALNLLGALDRDTYNITLVIDPGAVSASAEKLERFSQVPESVQVIGRCGAMVLSPEERWLRDRMNRYYDVTPNSEMWSIYMAEFRRDYIRMFGYAKFDVLVNFDGYSLYWASVFAAGGESGARKALYQHNDMYAEWILKFPNLRGLYSIYQEYDVYVSVSETIAQINRTNMVPAFGLDEARFDHCFNVIDSDELYEKASQPLDADLKPWLAGGKTFVNFGRMSPEKDQAKLIRAFAMILRDHPGARLLILGDGPLRHDLQAMISDLGLKKFVLLGGKRPNPFPVLRASACFVLSSNHEGQPMVLLEAMTLHKPIIATDIDGNRGVLAEPGYGLLVDNSVDGLAHGMRQFLEAGMSCVEFDAKKYQMSALERFYEVVVGGREAIARPHAPPKNQDLAMAATAFASVPVEMSDFSFSHDTKPPVPNMYGRSAAVRRDLFAEVENALKRDAPASEAEKNAYRAELADMEDRLLCIFRDDPNAREPLRYLALLCRKQGHFRESVKYWEQLRVQAQKSLDEANFSLGSAFAHTSVSNFSKAAAHLGQVSGQFEDNAALEYINKQVATRASIDISIVDAERVVDMAGAGERASVAHKLIATSLSKAKLPFSGDQRVVALLGEAYDVVSTIPVPLPAERYAGLMANYKLLRKPSSVKKLGPKIIFTSGFHWSGSGAVTDMLRGYPSINMGFKGMELVLFQYKNNLPTIFDAPQGKLNPWQLMYVFMSPIFGLLVERKNVYLKRNRSLAKAYLACFNSIDHLLEICSSLVMRLKQARDLKGEELHLHVLMAFREFAIDAVEGLREPDSDGKLLLNNAIWGFHARQLALFDNAMSVCVRRDPRDQYVAQYYERARHKVPTVEAFIKDTRVGLTNYYSAVSELDLSDRVIDTCFEDFVLDESTRKDILEQLHIDPASGNPLQSFEPEKSAKNIGLYKTFPHQNIIRKIEEGLSEFLYRG